MQILGKRVSPFHRNSARLVIGGGLLSVIVAAEAMVALSAHLR